MVYQIEQETPEGELEIKLTEKRKKHILAPGKYIYVISNEKNEVKRGKFAIIR